MKAAYYNEIDKHAAQWLRNLIAAGHIAPGDVDERSIEDVKPDDLRGYAQCHFFAGIGVWSYALRRAGWPDDRPVWTGSCPCQPFSQAGEGAGFDDERHLWPAWHWLIRECRPAKVFGEQVASKDAEPWLDLVSTDLEALGFAFGTLAFPSAGIGAPHIRDRTYFVADADYARPQGWWGVQERAAKRSARARRVAGGMADSGIERCDGIDAHIQQGKQGNTVSEVAGRSAAGWMADANSSTRGQGGSINRGGDSRSDALAWPGPGSNVVPRELADSDGGNAGAEGIQRGGQHGFLEEDGRIERIESAGPTNGFWRDVDWLLCRDEKWRPIEPGTFPLADGAPGRMGRLRAYGNAINAEAAVEFIKASEEAMTEGAALYHPEFRSSVMVAN